MLPHPMGRRVRVCVPVFLHLLHVVGGEWILIEHAVNLVRARLQVRRRLLQFVAQLVHELLTFFRFGLLEFLVRSVSLQLTALGDLFVVIILRSTLSAEDASHLVANNLEQP